MIIFVETCVLCNSLKHLLLPSQLVWWCTVFFKVWILLFIYFSLCLLSTVYMYIYVYIHINDMTSCTDEPRIMSVFLWCYRVLSGRQQLSFWNIQYWCNLHFKVLFLHHAGVVLKTFGQTVFWAICCATKNFSSETTALSETYTFFNEPLYWGLTQLSLP